MLHSSTDLATNVGNTSPSPSTLPGRAHAFLAGAAAAAVALATGELVAAMLGSQPSLVTAVGSEFIDRFAAALKNLAIALFGTNDKTALLVGIVVVSMTLGGALGIGARRFGPSVPLGFIAFGGLGAWALASNPQGSLGIAVVASASSAAAGVASFAVLWCLGSGANTAETRVASAGDHASAGMVPKAEDTTRQTRIDRRGFVIGVGGLALGAAAMGVVARRIRDGNSVEAARRTTVLARPGRSVSLPTSQPFSVPGLSTYVTPVDSFFRIDTALSTPQVDPDNWQLSIGGLVDRPFTLDYAELLSLDSVEEAVTIQCVSNEVGGRLVGNAVWQGVPLATLLERARVHSDATQIVGRSVDGWTAGFPTADAFDDRTALVAYAMNGEPLTAAHGFPARLVVSGLYGYVSATKWLEQIELTTWEGFDGYWIPRGWGKQGPIKTASRIDVPRDSGQLAAGTQPIAGVAWAPDRGIQRVEVQIDDGPWLECELGHSAGDDTWVQWHRSWEASSGEHLIRVRATDGDGVTQTEQVTSPAPDGATGWHSRRVRVA